VTTVARWTTDRAIEAERLMKRRTPRREVDF
jgi:hypothetical protein